MTWKGIRGTIQWMLVLLLATILVAAWGAMRLWSAKDLLLTRTVEKKLNDSFPDCDCAFRSARLLDASHLEVQDLILANRHNQAKVVQIPRLVIGFDGRMLAEYRRIAIDRVEIHSPEFYLHRDPRGDWNFAGIHPPKPSDATSPEIQILGGVLHVASQSLHGEIAHVRLNDLQARFLPMAHRRYDVHISGTTDIIGQVQLSGLIDANSGEWNLVGDAGGVRVDDPLLDLAGRFVPEVGRQLAELRQTPPQQQLGTESISPLKTASLQNGLGEESGAAAIRLTSSLMRADVSIHFELGQPRSAAPVDYSLTADIRNGQLSEQVLPVPLYDLEGHLEWTSQHIKIQDLKAANGASNLYVDGIASRTDMDSDWDKSFRIRATQLQIDERIRAFLPAKLLKVYDFLSPAGMFNVDVSLSQKPGEHHVVVLRRMELLNCKSVCEVFRYPIDNVRGEITQTGKTFQIDVQGEASGYPVTLKGTVETGRSSGDMNFQMHAEELPVDPTFVNAFQTEKLDKVYQTLKALNLSGTCSGDVQVIRNAKTDGEFRVQVDGALRNGTMNYEKFPYELSDLHGTLKYDPLERDAWLFENLSAKHQDSEFSGRGIINLDLDPLVFGLELQAERVHIDEDLERATIAASEGFKDVWNEFDISGLMDVERIQLVWQPDRPARVTMRKMQWRDGVFIPKSFPYRWDNVAGRMDWTGDRLVIHSLTGWHDNTLLSIDGTRADSPSYVETPAESEIRWRVHIEDLHCLKLVPNDDLKEALPDAISSPVKATRFTGPLDLHLTLDMKGWKHLDNLVTAEWKLLGVLSKNTLVAGTPLTDVTGTFRILKGVWDGASVDMEGYLKFDTVSALGFDFRNVTSPFKVDGNNVALGQPKPVGRQVVYHDQSNPYRRDQLKGEIYQGLIGLDVSVDVGDVNESYPFTMELNVQDVELAAWAKEQLAAGARLMGKVNANVKANGFGAAPLSTIGDGWVQITPAALYELPVFAQLFSFLRFRPVGNTAFNYAYGEFKIHSGLCDFQRVELVGEAMNLVGRGTVGYAGKEQSSLNMDFYSKATNPNPLIKPFVEAFGNNWVRVQVVGTVSKPILRIQPRIPLLDETFRGFMQTLEGGPSQLGPPRLPFSDVRP
ncbi:MAG: hypothetical protein KDA80_10035 [Planctomycetaceae bacterium]|nr:hypothetical protein [Planctomycetaceae bacterium]